jgi:hypothetical protein
MPTVSPIGGRRSSSAGTPRTRAALPPASAYAKGSTIERHSGARRSALHVMIGLTMPAMTPKTAAFQAYSPRVAGGASATIFPSRVRTIPNARQPARRRQSVQG